MIDFTPGVLGVARPADSSHSGPGAGGGGGTVGSVGVGWGKGAGGGGGIGSTGSGDGEGGKGSGVGIGGDVMPAPCPGQLPGNRRTLRPGRKCSKRSTQNGGGSSGSGRPPVPASGRYAGSRVPGGRVARVTPDGVVTSRMPSGVIRYCQCGAWVFNR
ncbi:MAG: hypothetical protein JWR66_2885 [Modestobacter sp.]|nr:hypothetical protein [Modestobacter sp.]